MQQQVSTTRHENKHAKPWNFFKWQNPSQWTFNHYLKLHYCCVITELLTLFETGWLLLKCITLSIPQASSFLPKQLNHRYLNNAVSVQSWGEPCYVWLCLLLLKRTAKQLNVKGWRGKSSGKNWLLETAISSPKQNSNNFMHKHKIHIIFFRIYACVLLFQQLTVKFQISPCMQQQ